MKKGIIATVGLLLVGWVLWQLMRPTALPQTMPEMTRFSPDQVASVMLKRGAEATLLLSLHDDVWMVANGQTDLVWNRADESSVFRLLDDLAGMNSLRVVTRNPERYEQLRVGDASIEVMLKDSSDKTLLHVRVGKQGSDLISTYVRFENGVEVVAVDRALVWQVNRSYRGWEASEPKTDSGKTEQ